MQYSRELREGSEDQRLQKKSARRRKQKKERERCFQPSRGGDSEHQLPPAGTDHRSTEFCPFCGFCFFLCNYYFLYF